MDKSINIYNSENSIMFTSNGDFNKVCNDNNLTGRALGVSYRENGSPIFNSSSKISITKAKNQGWYKFKGWYAKILIK